MVHFIYFCVAFVLLVPLSVQAKPEVYTLRLAVERALAANPSVEAKLLAIERAQMGVGVAQSYFLPSVSLIWSRGKLTNSGGVGTSEDYSNQSTTRGIRITLPLFSGFAHLNNLQKSLLSVDVENARHRQARLELIGNVQLQFLHLLKAREDMKTVQDSKKRIAIQLKAAKAFVQVGMAPYLNVLQNEVEMSKVTQQEIRVTNTIRNTAVMLNKYMGYEPNSNITFKGNLKDFNNNIGYNEEEAIKISIYNRPDLIIAQKSIAIALKQADITAGRYLPSVSASYDSMRFDKDYKDDTYSQDYSRNYWNIGLNISWEIFDGAGTTFTYLSDKKAAAALRKEYEDAMAGSRADVIRILLDIQAAKELVSAARKGVTAASESYAMANKRYQTNTGTITELLDAQVRLTEAEADYSQALMETHSARSRFFYNIGKENIGLE